MRLLAGVSGAIGGAIAIAAASLGGFAAPASASSLYSGPGPRPGPGPSILYDTPAVAPQLTNAGIWHAPPILVSGTTAYRDGEFLHQDYLYDDHGAHEVPDRPIGEPRVTRSPSRTARTRSRPGRAAAAFLGSATVDPNPAHVIYLVDPARDRPSYGIVGDHAYWVSGLTIRDASHTSANGDPEGQIDVFSHGFGTADPVASGSQAGTGTLTGGNMGPLAYASLRHTWGATLLAPPSDTLDITATNIATASVDISRTRVDCNAKLNSTSDGPISVTLAGCNRTVQGG